MARVPRAAPTTGCSRPRSPPASSTPSAGPRRPSGGDLGEPCCPLPGGRASRGTPRSSPSRSPSASTCRRSPSRGGTTTGRKVRSVATGWRWCGRPRAIRRRCGRRPAPSARQADGRAGVFDDENADRPGRADRTTGGSGARRRSSPPRCGAVGASDPPGGWSTSAAAPAGSPPCSVGDPTARSCSRATPTLAATARTRHGARRRRADVDRRAPRRRVVESSACSTSSSTSSIRSPASARTPAAARTDGRLVVQRARPPVVVERGRRACSATCRRYTARAAATELATRRASSAADRRTCSAGWCRRCGSAPGARLGGRAELGLDVGLAGVDRAAMVLTDCERATRRGCRCRSAPRSSASPAHGAILQEHRMTATDAELFELQETLYTSSNPTRRWLHCARRDWILTTLRSRLHERVGRALEVGPGSGLYLPPLAELADEVVGSDIEDAYLSRIGHLVGGSSAITLVRDDITRSSFPDDHFDCVLCTEVIEHIDDSQAALAEMRRILRPGGVLVLSTPQRYSPLEVCAELRVHARDPPARPACLSRAGHRDGAHQPPHPARVARTAVPRRLRRRGGTHDRHVPPGDRRARRHAGPTATAAAGRTDAWVPGSWPALDPVRGGHCMDAGPWRAGSGGFRPVRRGRGGRRTSGRGRRRA